MAATLATLSTSATHRPHRARPTRPCATRCRRTEERHLPGLRARVEVTKNFALASLYRGQFGLDLNVAANVKAASGAGRRGDITTLALALQTDTIRLVPAQQVVLGRLVEADRRRSLRTSTSPGSTGGRTSAVTKIETQLSVPSRPARRCRRHHGADHPAPTVVTTHLHPRPFVPHRRRRVATLARPTWEGFVRGGLRVRSVVPVGARRCRRTTSTGPPTPPLRPRSASLIRSRQVLPGETYASDVHGPASACSRRSDDRPIVDLVGDYTAGGTSGER